MEGALGRACGVWDARQLIDLNIIASNSRRRTWMNWVPAAFPGLQVRSISADPIGIVRRTMLMNTPVFTIVAAAQTLRGSAPKGLIQPRSGLIIQLDGANEIEQGNRRCRLSSGQMSLIDGSRPFEIEALGVSTCHVVHFEHRLAQTHFPGLLQQSGVRLDHDCAEARLLKGLIAIVVGLDETFSPVGGAAALGALLKLMNSLRAPTQAIHRAVPRRVREALADIEALVTEAELTPEALAARQRVSRRRLDALVVLSTGATLAAHISERRLTQAAAALCDPSQAKQSITEIAHGCGFRDGPHFSRSFRKRFDMTPREWRRRSGGCVGL